MPPPNNGAFPDVFLVFFLVFYCFMLLFVFAAWVTSALAVYDAARRAFPDPRSRANWCLLILLTNLIGAAVYYFVVYRHGDPPYQFPACIPPPPPKES